MKTWIFHRMIAQRLPERCIDERRHARNREAAAVGAGARNSGQYFDFFDLSNDAARALQARRGERAAHRQVHASMRLGLPASAAAASMRRATRASGAGDSGARRPRKKIVDDSSRRKKIAARTSLARRNRAARVKKLIRFGPETCGSEAELGFQQLVHRLRIGLPARGFHHLTDKPTEHRRFG